MTPHERVDAARKLRKEILAVHHRRSTDQARLAYMLARLDTTRGYRDLGYASVPAFAKIELGYSVRKTRDLLTLVERLEALPRIEHAFSAGELPWTKARLLARVATGEDEEEWLETARRSSRRQLELQVADALGEEPEIRVTLKLTPEEHLTLQEGVEALRSEGRNPTLASALAELVRRALNGGSTGSTAYRVVLYHCETCGATVRRGGERDVPVDEETLERVLCNAEVQDEESGHLRRTAPPAVVRQVRVRAGGRCEVPGCGNRSFLEIHHEGGWRRIGHDPERMLLLCGAHHTARHEGRLRIEGTATEGFRFFLADGTPMGEGVAPSGHPAGTPDPTGGPRAGPPCAPSTGTAPEREEAVASEGSGSVADRGTVPEQGRHPRPGARGAPRSEEKARPPSRERAEGRTASRRQAQRDAHAALRRLGFEKREARRLIARALERRPELRCGPAAELAKAALADSTGHPSPASLSGADRSSERARADRRGSRGFG